MRKLAVAALALSLVASCGGSDGESEPSSTDAPSEPTSAANTDAPADTATTSDAVAPEESVAPQETDAPAQDLAADSAAAQAALLVLSDFPAGWSEVPREDDTNEEFQNKIYECLGPDAVELLNSEAGARTGTFTDPADDSTVDEKVAVAANVESAEGYLIGGSADGVAECLTTVYREGIPDLLADAEDVPEDVEVGEITVGALNVGEIGDGTFAYRITAPIAVQGINIDLISDFVAVRVGRSVAGLNFMSQFDPTPIERITEYTTLAASRLPG